MFSATLILVLAAFAVRVNFAIALANVTSCNDVYSFYKQIYTVKLCSEFDGAVYWRIDNPLAWTGARAACQMISNQADLVSIHNFDELSLAARLASAGNPVFYRNPGSVPFSSCWIGYYQPGNTCGEQFVWSDGTSNLLGATKVKYESWYPGDPNCAQGQQHCAVFYTYYSSSAFWDDDNCSTAYASLCKVFLP